jgi:GntR family transcriptional regulator
MFTRIDPSSPIPLYEQIARRVRVAVAAAELRPGDALPSVRQLAKRLRVNPATVVQAYRELERDGFVELRQGAGSFIRKVGVARRRETREEEATRLARLLLQDAARLGIDGEDMLAAVRRELGERTP